MIKMSEKVEAQKFMSEKFLGRLDWFLDKPVNIEFFCGGCCKETDCSELNLVGRDFIELVGKCHSKFVVKTFLPGVGEVDVQEVKRILIPANRICDAEVPVCDPKVQSDEDIQLRDRPFENIRDRIECFWQDKIVAVEFECGDCCKKAEFGKLKFVGIDFIELTQVDKIPLKVKKFIAGVKKGIEVKLDRVIIPLDNVCSIETLESEHCD